MERTKMDLLACLSSGRGQFVLQGNAETTLTAYARRSPFASEDSCVGWPLVVEGLAAQMASIEAGQ